MHLLLSTDGLEVTLQYIIISLKCALIYELIEVVSLCRYSCMHVYLHTLLSMTSKWFSYR